MTAPLPFLAGTAAFAWMAMGAVLAGVLTAWADPVSGHCLNAVILALVALWLLRHRLDGGMHWLLLPLLWICCWGIVQLSLHWTVYPYETWNAGRGWLAAAAIFYLGFATLKEPRIRHSILSAILIFGTVLSAVGMIQAFAANGRVPGLIPTLYQDHVMGSFLNRDHYAVFAELVLPIALTGALLSANSRFMHVVASALIYTSVVLSASRAGTVLVSLEAAAVIAVALARNSREYRMALAVAAGMAVCSLTAGWDEVWFRFHAAHPLAFRREMVQATLQMIQARPLTGFGLGTWPAVYPAYAVFDPPGIFMNHAHNDWLEWLSDGGIPIALALVPIIYAATSLAKRNWWALGVPIAFLHAGVDFPMQKPAIAALTFFVLGSAAAAGTGMGVSSFGFGSTQK